MMMVVPRGASNRNWKSESSGKSNTETRAQEKPVSTAILILGESGSGKTTSLRNMDPQKTMLIQPVRKPLPFRSPEWKYFSRDESKPGHSRSGNMFVTDQSPEIVGLMKRTSRPCIVLDDLQYVLASEYMARSEEKSYEKFSSIGKHAWDILQAASQLDHNKRVYIFGHIQTDDFGRQKIKTIGKLLDEKIVPEGLFSIVLKSVVVNGKFYFSTKNSGSDTVKSPIGMFEDELVDNDLMEIDRAVCEYYGLGAGANA